MSGSLVRRFLENQQLPQPGRTFLLSLRNLLLFHGGAAVRPLEVHPVPFLGRYFAAVSNLSAVVQGFLVYDVEDDLRIDVAAEGAGADLGVGVVGRPLEVGDGLDGIAVVDRIAASVEEPQPVEELEYV